jgi:hypothetical protein
LDSSERQVASSGIQESSSSSRYIFFNEYAFQSDPIVLPRGSHLFDPQGVVYCTRGYGNRHGRLYDVARLTSRIRNNLGALRLTIYVVENEKEVSPRCYVKFVALLEKGFEDHGARPGRLAGSVRPLRDGTL